MRSSECNDSTSLRPRQVLAAVRDEVRERRQARRDYRVLADELVSYNTRPEVDDLLAALENETSTEAEQIRTILGRNLQNHHQRAS